MDTLSTCYLARILSETVEKVVERLIEQDNKYNELSELLRLRNEFQEKHNISPLGLVTATDAANLIGVKSTSTIYAMLDQGVIPEVKINSLRFIHIEDIEKYIKDQRNKEKRVDI